jgi:hypothetical protein
MMHSSTLAFVRSSLSCLSCLLIIVPADVLAQDETFSAVASMKTAGGVSASAPVTVVVSQFATDADHAALVGVLKKGGTAAVKEWLSKRADAGRLQLGARRTPIKFAYSRPTGEGRLITVATAEPIVFAGAGLPGAKTTEGYELGLVLLDVVATGPGRGELSPAAKVRVNEQGAIVTEDYNAADVVHLSNVVKK